MGRTVRRAARILTGTDVARNSILRVYPHLEEDKVVVVPLAAAPEFRPISREAAVAAVRERHSIGGPFILSVGDMQPRKNHIGLIRAFARPGASLPAVERITWCWWASRPGFRRKVQEAARESGVGDRIQFVGFVADADLLQFYNACDCFVFPSFYEGFGFPALEAMACGRAVVCSDASALPEVVDGAAILFDPYAIDEMVRAIADVLLDVRTARADGTSGVYSGPRILVGRRRPRLTLEAFHQVVEQPRAAVGRLASQMMTHR